MPVQIYTDGSCLGNPGPGGWAFLIHGPKGVVRHQGGEAHTTNNRMELTAVIEALTYLSKHHSQEKDLKLFSDSSWVVNTLTQNWKRKKNLDLWAKLTPLLVEKKIQWLWVRGHNGHPENEDCDRQAQKAAQKQLRNLKAKPSAFPQGPL